jgi:hypothetical protein
MRFPRFVRFALAALALTALGACTMLQGPPPISPTQVLSMTSAPVAGPDVKFSFAPITGVPSELLQAFNKAVTKHAAARKLTVVPAGDPTATYVVKGYLSAIGDSKSSLLVYVFDVSDQSGKRLRRISGQEIGRGSRSDPWGGIGTALVVGVGESTIDELVAWSN